MKLENAISLMEGYDKIPSSVRGRVDFVQTAYGYKIRGRSVGEMSEGQILHIAENAWKLASDMYGLHKTIQGIRTGIEGVTDEVLNEWVERCSGEESLNEDSRSLTERDVSLISQELLRRHYIARLNSY